MLKFNKNDIDFEFSILKNNENKVYIAKHIKIIFKNSKYNWNILYLL
jgi:hypothetical protein